MARFEVRLQHVPSGWELCVFDHGAGRPLAGPDGAPLVRRLRRTDRHRFPLPPLEEVGAVDPAEAHAALCADADGALVQRAYQDIVAGQVRDGAVATFGRYLFATALGEALWQDILTRAGAQPLELRCFWDDDDAAINRLPWEMLCSARGFLAAEPQVAITRGVAETAAVTAGTIASPPKVLFAIGARQLDPAIRPGAEYLGLLRHLREAELALGLKTHLLLEATTGTLAAAVEWFRPSVVHLICHGGFDGGQAYLALVDERDPTGTVSVGAESLRQILLVDGRLPQIVVLNACFSASAEDAGPPGTAQVAAPLAVELVRAGVPIVVGMAGEVADRACRLFTRGFYRALLQGGGVSWAAAGGRRAGLLRRVALDPRSAVDWALPALFLAEGVEEARLEVDPAQLAAEQRWHRAADDYATPAHPAFCDRLSLVEAFNVLLADRAAQKALLHRDYDMQVLAVGVDQADAGGGPQYGRTWLLRELAAQAARLGHLPVLVQRDWPPSDDYIGDLLDALDDACLVTATRFDLDWAWRYLPALRLLPAGAALPAAFPPALRDVYRGKPLDPNVLAVALRLDLLALLAAARQQRGDDGARTRLLLLVDDLHRMDLAAPFFLQHLLGTLGLRGARVEAAGRETDLRAVFTYSSVAILGQGGAIKAITAWLERTNWAEVRPLQAFQFPHEQRLAYEHLLLHWRQEGRPQPMALISRPDTREFVESFFQALNQDVQGIPSNFALKVPSHIVAACAMPPRYRVLWEVDEDDDTALARSAGLRRGAGQ